MKSEKRIKEEIERVESLIDSFREQITKQEAILESLEWVLSQEK